MFYTDFIKNKANKNKIEDILFEMGLTTDIVLEGVNDRYEEGLKELEKIGEKDLAIAIRKNKINFNI
jgi:hypothetical protein